MNHSITSSSRLSSLHRRSTVEPTPRANFVRAVLVLLLRLPVVLHVRLRRPVPPPVLPHDRVHQQLPPPVIAAVRHHRAIQRGVDVVRLRAVERVPVGFRLLHSRAVHVLVDVEHRVSQPARASHHRHGAVPHRDQLREPARLEHGRHEDHVGGGVDEVRQRLVEREDEAGLPRVLLVELVREVVEVVLHVAVRGGPQQDELPALLERALRRVLDQVHALLLREARDDADDGRPGLREVHREPLRELRLRRLFSRFPHLDVDAVADAHELLFVVLDRVVVRDLSRVRRRDGRRERASLQRATEEVLAKLEVVDRDHRRRRRRQERAAREDDRRGRPIVRVHDVGLVHAVLQPVQRALREKLEAHVVVAAAVDAPDVEVAVVGLQKHDGHLLHLAPPHVQNDTLELELLRLLQDHLDGVPLLHDGAAERGDDVAHAANLGDRRHLHGDVHDPQLRVAPSRALRVYVVIERVVAVVFRLAAVPAVVEEKIHHVRVRGRRHRRLERGERRRPARRVVRPLHLDRTERLSVRPSVPAPLHEHLVDVVQRVITVVLLVTGPSAPTPSSGPWRPAS
eukprot:29502-Pelagococcus_subviridis.AAC.2